MKIKYLKEDINNITNEDYNMNSLIGELSDEELLKFCSDIDINIPDGEMEIATGDPDRDGDYPYEDFPIKFKYEPLFIEHYEDEVDWRIITLNVHGECCGYYDDYEVEIEDVDPSMTLNQFQEILKKNLVDAANQLEHDGLENGEYDDGSDYREDMDESFDKTTVEDMIEGSVGNMSEDEIDRDLKTFNRIKRAFKMRRIEDIFVVVSDGEEAPQHYDDYFNWDIIPLTKDGLVRYISEDNKIDMITEKVNNNYYLYFKYESEANRYLKMIEGINNGDYFPIKEALNEDYDKEFLDKYNPIVDITNKKRYTYKKYDNKEFVYDNENALLIWVYKDEDEIKELGKANTPYRELDAIGLSRDNWEESPEYWLE